MSCTALNEENQPRLDENPVVLVISCHACAQSFWAILQENNVELAAEKMKEDMLRRPQYPCSRRREVSHTTPTKGGAKAYV